MSGKSAWYQTFVTSNGGFGLLRRHDLHIEFPFREVAALDRLIKLPCGETRVRFRRLFRQPGVRRPESGRGLEVIFDPHILVPVVVPHEGVAGIAVHLLIGGGRAAVRKQDRHLMQRLRRQRQEIPEHGCVLEIAAGIPLPGADEVREFDRVADEKDRHVAADQIIIALFGIEFDRESARIADRVGRAAFTAVRRKTGEKFGLSAGLAEQARPGVFREIVRDFEVTERTGASGGESSNDTDKISHTDAGRS